MESLDPWSDLKQKEKELRRIDRQEGRKFSVTYRVQPGELHLERLAIRVRRRESTKGIDLSVNDHPELLKI